MKLSVILISYDMAREIPRTLQSLSRGYQQGALDLAYEVLLVDNGSPEPLNEATWADVDVPVRLIRVQDAAPSPAGAINTALNERKIQKVDGIIGADTLKKANAIIDYEKNRLYLKL